MLSIIVINTVHNTVHCSHQHCPSQASTRSIAVIHSHRSHQSSPSQSPISFAVTKSVYSSAQSYQCGHFTVTITARLLFRSRSLFRPTVVLRTVLTKTRAYLKHVYTDSLDLHLHSPSHIRATALSAATRKKEIAFENKAGISLNRSHWVTRVCAHCPSLRLSGFLAFFPQIFGICFQDSQT
jgi:hypothetical protein